MRAHAACLLSLIACAESPGGAVITAPVTTSPVPEVAMGDAAPPPAQAPPESVDGRYDLDGEIRVDGCHGQIILGSEHLRIDTRRGVLHADLVNRDYKLEVQGGQLYAEGTFTVPNACTPIHESWTLTPTSPGRLEGKHEGTWSLAPACKECRVVFEVWADKSRGRAHDSP